MKKHWVIFTNGVKFFIMADSFDVSGSTVITFTRGTGGGAVVQTDYLMKSVVAAILIDGTIDDTGNAQPLVG